jgi:hypothetical protein
MSPSPSSALRARVLEAARREPVRTRAQGLRATALTLAVGFGAPVLLSWIGGCPNHTGRPLPYEALVTATFALVAGLATWAGVSRGRSMLGHPPLWRLLVAVVTPTALLALALLAAALWPETELGHDGWGDLMTCLIFTPLFAAGPLLAFTVIRRRSDPVAPRLSGAAIGAAAGAWGAVGISLHCRHVTPLHVAGGHVLPVAMLALLGVLLGQHVVALRTKTG